MIDSPTKQESIDHALLKLIIIFASFAWVTVFGLVGYIGISIKGSVDEVNKQLIEFKLDISQRLTKVESQVQTLSTKDQR